METENGGRSISVVEAGRKGGTTTRDRYGSQFYEEIGRKGGATTRRLYAHLFKVFGSRGGRPKRPPFPQRLGEEDLQ